MIKPMLCNVYKEGKIPFPCMVQPKLDGVRCLVSKDEVFTRNQKPHKDHVVDLIRRAMSGVALADHILDGELMLADATFQETVSAVKKDSCMSESLVYHVYDVYHPTADLTFGQRLTYIKAVQCACDTRRIKIVPTYEADNQHYLDDHHRAFVEAGYEGSIIRDPDARYMPGSRRCMWKRKDFKDAEFEVVDFEEGTGKNAGTPVFICVTEDGKEFGCVPMGAYDRKRQMWKDRWRIRHKMMTVRYQELTDSGIPRFPVGVEIRDYE